MVPEGSSDLMKLSWEETEATPNYVLEGRKRYKLVTMDQLQLLSATVSETSQ